MYFMYISGLERELNEYSLINVIANHVRTYRGNCNMQNIFSELYTFLARYDV